MHYTVLCAQYITINYNALQHKTMQTIVQYNAVRCMATNALNVRNNNIRHAIQYIALKYSKVQYMMQYSKYSTL